MTSQAHDDTRPPIVGRALRQWWVLIVLFGVVLAVLAGLVTLTRSARYTSTVGVYLQPTTGNAFAPLPGASTQQLTTALQTEASLVTSSSVTALASTQLREFIPAGTGAVTATVLLNSQVIDISYTAGSSNAAANGAQAFADSFLTFRKNQSVKVQQQQVATLTGQISQANAQLKAAAIDAASAHPSPGAAARVQLFANKVTALQSSIGDAEALPTDPGNIATPPNLPSGPDGINPLLLVFAVFVFGCAAGAGLAIWRTRADGRVYPAWELSVAEVPILSAVEVGRSRKSARLIDAETNGPSREPYRRLRTTLLAGRPRPAVVTFAGVDEEVGSSDVAVNLAISLAEAGYEVALVDAVVDEPSVADLLGISAAPGVADIVRGTHEVGATLVLAHGFQVVPAGQNPTAVRESYAGERFSRMVKELGGLADYVVVASPPLTEAAGLAGATVTDCTVLVFELSRSTHEEISDLTARARSIGITVQGLVGVGTR